MTAVSFDRDCGFCIGCVDHFEKNNRFNSSCAKGRKLAVIKGRRNGRWFVCFG